MPKLEQLSLVWLTSTNCDGCTIKALGDTSAGGLEALLTGKIPGMPRVRLFHPYFALEKGDAFVANLEKVAAGELGPFALINEGAVPDEALAGPGFFSSLGEKDGTSIRFGEWLRKLAPRALFVLAWGDCAVWGGPHSLQPNPTGSTGTAMHLGVDYRSTLGLPVINLTGCAAPPVLMATLTKLVKWAQGVGPALELDQTYRPKFAYKEIWKGAFVAWRG